MEEPIGQFVKRFSLEQQVVLFIDSNDEYVYSLISLAYK